MAGNNNFTEPQNFKEAWMRAEKRQQRQERRTPGAAGAVVSNEGLVERVFQGGTQQPLVSAAFIIPAGDWAIETQEGIANQQSYGTLVQWYIRASRTGPPIVVGAGGDIGNSLIGTLTAGWVPIISQTTNNGGAGRLSSFLVEDTGLVYLTAVGPGGANIATGEDFGFGSFYIAASAIA